MHVDSFSHDFTFCSKQDCKNMECKRNLSSYPLDTTFHYISVSELASQCEWHLEHEKGIRLRGE